MLYFYAHIQKIILLSKLLRKIVGGKESYLSSIIAAHTKTRKNEKRKCMFSFKLLCKSILVYNEENEKGVSQMINYYTTKEIAELWGINERQVADYCRTGEIQNAHKKSGRWLIPVDAINPHDYPQEIIPIPQDIHPIGKLPLPIGDADFCSVVEHCYYVDKTLLIKDILDEGAKVSLFTRPRRFGKTLNMDMLRVFFEISDRDTSIYFKDKAIWECGENYCKHQGKYPVIYLSFKDICFDTWEGIVQGIKELLIEEFERHAVVVENELCTNSQKKYFYDLVEERNPKIHLQRALKVLSKMLFTHYKEKVIIIIDEYDVPIQQGRTYNFYNDIVTLMRGLLSGGLKDNSCLAYGFLTGILRVAKESIFSGLNNLKVNSVLTQRYSQYFGFTQDEVKEMLAYYGYKDKYDELQEWYDGYKFGTTEIFNPWSVIGYLNEQCNPHRYWVSTSKNDIIGEVLGYSSKEVYDSLASLLTGKTVESTIDIAVTYEQLENNPAAVHSLLLVAGYLKTVRKLSMERGDGEYELALPNKEIKMVYADEILSKYGGMHSTIGKYLVNHDDKGLEYTLNEFVLKYCSVYDVAQETFYHGILLGLIVQMDGKYIISSNLESGYGRFDLEMLPINKFNPGIILEVKYKKDATTEALEESAKNAYKQIQDRRYDTNMHKHGVKTVYKFGISFSGKHVKVYTEK